MDFRRFLAKLEWKRILAILPAQIAWFEWSCGCHSPTLTEVLRVSQGIFGCSRKCDANVASPYKAARVLMLQPLSQMLTPTKKRYLQAH